ncbi:MAG: ATP-binding protein [Planctomycetota bacterium]
MTQSDSETAGVPKPDLSPPVPVTPIDDDALTISTPVVVFGISAVVILASLLIALSGTSADATLACGLLVIAPLLVGRLAGMQAGFVSALACLFGGFAVLMIAGSFGSAPLLALLLSTGIGCLGAYLLGDRDEPADEGVSSSRLREMERDTQALREQLRQSRDRADAAEQRSAAVEKAASEGTGKLTGADRQLADAAMALTNADDRARTKEREVERRKRAVLSEQLAAATAELELTKAKLAELEEAQAEAPAEPQTIETEPPDEVSLLLVGAGTPLAAAANVDEALRCVSEAAAVPSVALLLGPKAQLAQQNAGIASAVGGTDDHDFARTAAARVAETGKAQVFTDLASIEADAPRTAAAVPLPADGPSGVLVAIGHGETMEDKQNLLETAAFRVAELAAEQSARVQVDKLAKQMALLELQLRTTENSLASTESALAEARSEVIEDGTGLSKQMSTPLSNLRKYADVLKGEQGDDLSEVGHECLAKMQESVAVLEGLAGELQRFGDLGRQEIVPEPTKVVEVVDAVLERMNEPLSRVTVRRDSSIAGVPEVMGEADALGQALTALLDNAAKFHAPGTKPTIEIAAEKRGDFVRLWVKDDGIGMPEAASDSVFLPFERLHPDERYAGSGIGLAVAARVARRLGGAIGVDSDVGRGSRFWLDLRSAD